MSCISVLFAFAILLIEVTVNSLDFLQLSVTANLDSTILTIDTIGFGNNDNFLICLRTVTICKQIEKGKLTHTVNKANNSVSFEVKSRTNNHEILFVWNRNIVTNNLEAPPTGLSITEIGVYSATLSWNPNWSFNMNSQMWKNFVVCYNKRSDIKTIICLTTSSMTSRLTLTCLKPKTSYDVYISKDTSSFAVPGIKFTTRKELIPLPEFEIDIFLPKGIHIKLPKADSYYFILQVKKWRPQTAIEEIYFQINQNQSKVIRDNFGEATIGTKTKVDVYNNTINVVHISDLPDGDNNVSIVVKNVVSQAEKCSIYSISTRNREKQFSCIPECFEPGIVRSYQGYFSKTENGMTCLNWKNQRKQIRNYCRIPKPETKPWCDKPKSAFKWYHWDYCDIKPCNTINAVCLENLQVYQKMNSHNLILTFDPIKETAIIIVIVENSSRACNKLYLLHWGNERYQDISIDELKGKANQMRNFKGDVCRGMEFTAVTLQSTNTKESAILDISLRDTLYHVIIHVITSQGPTVSHSTTLPVNSISQRLISFQQNNTTCILKSDNMNSNENFDDQSGITFLRYNGSTKMENFNKKSSPTNYKICFWTSKVEKKKRKCKALSNSLELPLITNSETYFFEVKKCTLSNKYEIVAKTEVSSDGGNIGCPSKIHVKAIYWKNVQLSWEAGSKSLKDISICYFRTLFGPDDMTCLIVKNKLTSLTLNCLRHNTTYTAFVTCFRNDSLPQLLVASAVLFETPTIQNAFNNSLGIESVEIKSTLGWPKWIRWDWNINFNPENNISMADLYFYVTLMSMVEHRKNNVTTVQDICQRMYKFKANFTDKVFAVHPLTPCSTNLKENLLIPHMATINGSGILYLVGFSTQRQYQLVVSIGGANGIEAYLFCDRVSQANFSTLVYPTNCISECLNGTNDYVGHQSLTKSGHSCLPWRDNNLDERIKPTFRSPHFKINTFCQKANGIRGDKPWCYYTTKSEHSEAKYEDCNISECSNRKNSEFSCSSPFKIERLLSSIRISIGVSKRPIVLVVVLKVEKNKCVDLFNFHWNSSLYQSHSTSIESILKLANQMRNFSYQVCPTVKGWIQRNFEEDGAKSSTLAILKNISTSTVFNVDVYVIDKSGPIVTMETNLFVPSVPKDIQGLQMPNSIEANLDIMPILTWILIAMILLTGVIAILIAKIKRSTPQTKSQQNTTADLVMNNLVTEVPTDKSQKNIESPENNLVTEVPSDKSQKNIESPESTPIDISCMDNYILSVPEEDWLKQFDLIKCVAAETEKNRGLTVFEASKPENKTKNKYRNILPYDHTLVVLESVDSDPSILVSKSYINANYVAGENQPREYIAAQGPLETTINDFWHLIWQEQIRLIVMLTNTEEKGVMKCKCYWPEVGTPLTFDFGHNNLAKIELISEVSQTAYVIRQMNVTFENKSRKVNQVHFTGWLDHQTPNVFEFSSFLDIFGSMKSSSHSSPILVHCSAGVGRTGTLICIDRLCHQVTSGATTIDVKKMILDLRTYRTTIVQNVLQYQFIFIYMAHILNGYNSGIIYANYQNDNEDG